MAERIDLPPTLQGDEKSQLEQMWRYLYQLSESINNNLEAIGGNDLTDTERATMQQILAAAGGGDAQGAASDYETLKSLIIKTADFVQTSLQEYRMKLLGETVASGQFGRYVRQTGLDVEVTPTGITQNYSLREIAEDLKHYEVNAKNYIKTGLLRTVSSIPVYGVAIGKDIVTFSNDGTETYNDGNKVAELTADELSFWQGGEKIASYTGSAITFYYGGYERVKIDSSGITFKNGNTKLAEILTSALKFYYNGTLRTQMDTDGIKLYDGSTLLAKYTSSGLEFYQNSMINAKFTGNRIGFYYNGTEVFYIQQGKLYSATNFAISSGKMIEIGNWEFRESGITNSYVQNERVVQFIYGKEQDLVFTGADTLGIGHAFYSYAGSNDQEIMMVYNGRNDNDYYRTVIKPGKELYCEKGASSSPTNRTGVKGTLGRVSSNSSYERKWDVVGDTVYYSTLIQNSSRYIKHGIKDLESMGEKLDRLQPVTFVYDRDEKNRQHAGLIYEDTQKVMPEICIEENGQRSITYIELVPMLLKEIQDLRARVKALEER